MSDHLDLGLEHETAEAGRPTHAARELGLAIVLVAVIAVIVVAGVVFSRGLSGVRSFFGAPADYSGAGTTSVVVQVHPGDTLSAIGQTLHKQDVVKSAGAFTRVASSDARAKSIGPGFYKLRHHMKASLALGLLLDPKALVASRVVVPEGMRSDAILAGIAKNTQIKLADLQQAAKDPVALGVPAWGAGHGLEGFLFPATYTFGPDTTAKQALSATVSRFNQEAASLDIVGEAQRHHRSPYAVLTMASIVQREGRLDSDFPKIAEVFYNRLTRGMTLGSDATLYYIKPLGYGLLT